MAEPADRFLVHSDRPLIGIIVSQNNEELIQYSTVDVESEPLSDGAGIQRVLDLAGAWSDLDWIEVEAELDSIRHQSAPTPPITE